VKAPLRNAILQMLRKVPVVLPSYPFDVIGESDKASVETRGTSPF
jgi:hypothetical protein